MFYYFGYLSAEVGNWVIVWSGIDRYISVKYPKRYPFRDNLKFQILIVLIMIIIGMLINIPYAIQVDLISQSCQVVDFSLAFYQSISITLLSTFIPGILMIVFTVLIFKILANQKSKLHQDHRKENSFLKVLVSLYILFLISYMPYCICAIISYIWKITFVGSVLYQVTNYLGSVYTSFDFFIYFFSNRLFRQYCLSIFCGSTCKKIERTTSIDKGH